MTSANTTTLSKDSTGADIPGFFTGRKWISLERIAVITGLSYVSAEESLMRLVDYQLADVKTHVVYGKSGRCVGKLSMFRRGSGETISAEVITFTEFLKHADIANFPEDINAPLTIIEKLTCCSCSGPASGRSWWGRDAGYGLCAECIIKMIEGWGMETIKSVREMGGLFGIHIIMPSAEETN